MALLDPQDAPVERVCTNSGRTFAALVLPHPDRVGEPGRTVAGITIAERQRRQIELLAGRLVASPAEARDEDLLLIEPGLIADERAIAALREVAGQGGCADRTLVAVGPDGVPGGLAWLPVARRGGGNPDWRSLAHGMAECFELAAIDTYAPERRRRVPLVWERPRDAATARAAAAKLLDAAQKGCLDWPARFVHPPIENFAVRLLWPTPITPNAVSLAAFFLGLYAAWSFASGNLWTGLLLALLVGPIDGIDGKLARTRVEYSRWGDIEHVGDKIVEYLWFFALAAALGRSWAWALAAMIVFLALAEALQGEFYRRMTGAQLDDAGPPERAFRLVSGRRNTFFWCLLPFAWFEGWHAGLIMIAVYAALNFFFMQWRFFVRLAEYGRANSAAIAANLDATAYGFMSSDTFVANKDAAPRANIASDAAGDVRLA